MDCQILRKFENCDIEIARVNSIFNIKYINLQLFTLILYTDAVGSDQSQFSKLSPLIDMSMIEHKIY